MAEGVCFSVLQLFHFPAQDSCVFQSGHCMCPRMVTWPRFAASQQLAESVLQALQKSESHLTLVCALILCQDPVRAQEQWRVGNQFRAGCSGVPCSLPRLGHLPRLTFSLLGGLLPLEVSQIHTATPIVRAADSVDLGWTRIRSCHFQFGPHLYSQAPGRGVNFSR